MRVVNNTKWKTAHLHAFLQRCANIELSGKTKEQIVINVKYNRQVNGGCSGYFHLGAIAPVVTIMLPSQTVDKVDLASVAVHEFGHARGLLHGQMRGAPRYRRVGNWRDIYSWANELPLEKKEGKKKQRVTTQDRLTKIQVCVAQWETKLKRAQTYLKKLKAKARYYERKNNAVSAVPVPNEYQAVET
jgi:hypothetical protein